MRFGSIAGKAVALVSFGAVSILAHGESNTYEDIPRRNVFGLKPPIINKPVPPELSLRPVPTLTLTGVVDFSIAKWALITRTDPGRPSSAYTLTPGEIEGGLQILDLDARKATVTVRVDGTDTVVLHLPSTNQAAQISGFGRTPPPVPY